MPTGMSHCRICGKPIPSPYRKWHEKVQCLVMRLRRGDLDVIYRKILPRVIVPRPVGHPNQKRLLEFGVCLNVLAVAS